jgi:Tfp pilus assembly protein PilO
LVLTLCALIIEPVIQLYESHQEWLATAQASVARDRGLLLAEQDLRKQLTGIEHSPLLARLYPTDAPGALATSLQADLGGLLARAGVTAQTIAPLPSTADELIERAGVRVVLTLTIDQLRTFMGLLESHPRLIRVDELVITAPQSQLRDHNPTLNVALVLLAFRLRHGMTPQTTGANAGRPLGPH